MIVYDVLRKGSMSDSSHSPRNSLSSDDFRSSTESTPSSPAELIQKVRRQSLLGRESGPEAACVDSVAHLAQQVAAVARMNLEFSEDDIAFDDERYYEHAVSSHTSHHVVCIPVVVFLQCIRSPWSWVCPLHLLRN